MDRSVVKRNEAGQVNHYVIGSYRQGDIRFGSTMGQQCSCIALFTLCWSTVRKVSVWYSYDIDNIVNVSNFFYNMMGISMYLTADDLSASSELYGHMFDVHLSGFETGEMTVKTIDVQWIEEVILTRTI